MPTANWSRATKRCRRRHDAVDMPSGKRSGPASRAPPGGARQAGLQCWWQAPGPSGCPQLPQGAGRSLRLVGEALAALKADSFLRRSVLSHCGQCSAGEDWRTSFSNSCPQAAHSYSKMGMVSILPMVPKTLAVLDLADCRGRTRMLPVFALPEDREGRFALNQCRGASFHDHPDAEQWRRWRRAARLTAPRMLAHSARPGCQPLFPPNSRYRPCREG
jgi:hypothetical protein